MWGAIACSRQSALPSPYRPSSMPPDAAAPLLAAREGVIPARVGAGPPTGVAARARAVHANPAAAGGWGCGAYCGLIFLLPFTRPIARNLLHLFIARRAARSGLDLDVMRAKVERDTLIRGETVPDDAPRKDPEPPSDQIVIKGEIEP